MTDAPTAVARQLAELGLELVPRREHRPSAARSPGIVETPARVVAERM